MKFASRRELSATRGGAGGSGRGAAGRGEESLLHAAERLRTPSLCAACYATLTTFKRGFYFVILSFCVCPRWRCFQHLMSL